MNEKTALLDSSSSRAGPTTKYTNIAKISSIITILLILIIAIVNYHPTKIDNVSESFINFGGVFSSFYGRETPGNESNIMLIHYFIIILIY